MRLGAAGHGTTEHPRMRTEGKLAAGGTTIAEDKRQGVEDATLKDMTLPRSARRISSCCFDRYGLSFDVPSCA
jgi:hypothetical protein